MKNRYTLLHQRIIALLFLLISFHISSQEDFEIIEAYEDYTKAPREVVYLHLNKSTYYIGETIGFTAYVLDKNEKKPSLLTTNLYVSIEDKAKNIIKQKLIMVNNGIASNIFEVDSLFSEGNYTVKAYTNWMLNFNEQNYFIESVKIKDQETKQRSIKENITKKIDAQFLPESGHLLNGVRNNIGVIIKDQYGYGIPFAEGEVLDQNNNVLTTFKTNQLGIGRFPLFANINNQYKIKINANNKIFDFSLKQPIEENGVVLSVKKLKQKLFVSAVTNPSTLNIIKNKRYTLLLHNGETSDLMDIYFNDDTMITKVLDLNGSPGVNILTLFNENDQPIAERLIFNYEGIDIVTSEPRAKITKAIDSMSIKLNYKAIDITKPHNISVSVLPQETESYARHHNLISYTYLQPYLKSPIENGKYYFTNIDERKKFELDNLLITQGWSSYSWNEIFKGSPNLAQNFERGITVKANIPSKSYKNNSTSNQLMYYLTNEGFLISELKEGEKNHTIESLYPEENNTLKLSQFSSKNVLQPASGYLQFSPNKFPKLNQVHYKTLITSDLLNREVENEYSNNTMIKLSDDVQKLDEVLVKSKLNPNLERRNKINRGRFGRVKIVDEEDEKAFPFLSTYLVSRGLIVNDTSTGLEATFVANLGKLGDSLNAARPKSVNFFLDDMLLTDTFILNRYSMANIDFIEIDRFGTGDGMRSPNGYIKIYTKSPDHNRYRNKSSKSYKFPLTFSAQKKFYTPKYQYYNDDFFKGYGTIDWKPNLYVDSAGNIDIKIAKPEVPITLFIEGISDDGSFIFEEKSISLN